MNEEVDETDARVYITSLLKDGERYMLGASISDEDSQMAILVFSQILREAMTGKRRSSDIPYHLVDISSQVMVPAPLKEHRTFNIEKEWAVKLLGFQPSAQYGQAFESDTTQTLDDSETGSSTGELVEQSARLDQQEDIENNDGGNPTTGEVREEAASPQTLSTSHEENQNAPPQTSALHERESPSTCEIPIHEAEYFLREVQVTLEEFSNISLKLTQQKEQTQAQQTALESRELKLRDMELLLTQKKEQLVQANQRNIEQREQQDLRETKLDAREEMLKRMTLDLSEQIKHLSAAKEKLSALFKGLEDAPK